MTVDRLSVFGPPRLCAPNEHAPTIAGARSPKQCHHYDYGTTFRSATLQSFRINKLRDCDPRNIAQSYKIVGNPVKDGLVPLGEDVSTVRNLPTRCLVAQQVHPSPSHAASSAPLKRFEHRVQHVAVTIAIPSEHALRRRLQRHQASARPSRLRNHDFARSTSNAAMFLSSRLNSTPRRWIGCPRPRYLSAYPLAFNCASAAPSGAASTTLNSKR